MWIYNGIMVFSVLFSLPFRIIPHFIFGCRLQKAIITHKLHSWVLLTNSESIVIYVIRILVLFPGFYHFTFIKVKFNLSFSQPF